MAIVPRLLLKRLFSFIWIGAFVAFSRDSAFHTTALDHKSINNTVENCVIIETVFTII